jgi:hypothetical protein
LTVSNAIDAVRPFTSTFAVFAPVVVTAGVIMTIATAPGYVHADVAALVKTALQAFINSLPRDAAAQTQTLPYSRLAQVAYDASPGVTNVTGVTLNAGTSDVVATPAQVIKFSTVVVN